MKKSIVFLLSVVLTLSVVSCGKSEKTNDNAKGEKKTEVKADEKKVEDKKVSVKADNIANLFVILDKAIKNGSLKEARKLYDAKSNKKLSAAIKLMGDTSGLDAQIKFEVNNKGKYSTPLKVVSKKGGKVTVKWPSGKTTAGIAVIKKGGIYKINLMKSPGADLIDM